MRIKIICMRLDILQYLLIFCIENNLFCTQETFFGVD